MENAITNVETDTKNVVDSDHFPLRISLKVTLEAKSKREPKPPRHNGRELNRKEITQKKKKKAKQDTVHTNATTVGLHMLILKQSGERTGSNDWRHRCS